MDIVLIVKAIVGLVALLGILVSLLIYTSQSRENKREKKREKKRVKSPLKEEITLESLRKIIKNRNTTEEGLSRALSKVIEKFGTITPKLGTRTHPDFDIYAEMLIVACHHPQTNKDIIIKFEKALQKRNANYSKEINDALAKGLNSRGI